MDVVEISYKEAIGFLLPRHYSGRKPQVKWAFGWKEKDELLAVCTFGKPASNTLCDGVCGKSFSSQVYELNRLCRVDGLNLQLSEFVAGCLRRLSSENLIVVSYADTGMSHVGYVYQACNFVYTGCTKERLEFYSPGAHSRHGNKFSDKRKVRTAKHRYIFFAFENRREKRKAVSQLKYQPQPYPKGPILHYKLGNYQKPTVVDFKRRK